MDIIRNRKKRIIVAVAGTLAVGVLAFVTTRVFINAEANIQGRIADLADAGKLIID